MITDKTLFVVNLDNLRGTTLLAHLHLFILPFLFGFFGRIFRWPFSFFVLLRFLCLKDILLFFWFWLRFELNAYTFLFVSFSTHLPDDMNRKFGGNYKKEPENKYEKFMKFTKRELAVSEVVSGLMNNI